MVVATKVVVADAASAVVVTAAGGGVVGEEGGVKKACPGSKEEVGLERDRGGQEKETREVENGRGAKSQGVRGRVEEAG